MESGKRAWLWGGLAVATGIGLVVALGGDKQPAAVGDAGDWPEVGPMRVLLIGDGFAAGLETPLRVLYEGEGMIFGADVHLDAKVSDWLAGRLEAAIVDFAPDLLILSLGTTDILSAEPADEKDFVALVELIQTLMPRSGSRSIGPTNRFVWIDPPPVPVTDKTADVRRFIAEHGGKVFPSRALDIPRGPDGLHPTAKGYAGWAGALWQWLRLPAPPPQRVVRPPVP